jgi:hypothetical protein
VSVWNVVSHERANLRARACNNSFCARNTCGKLSRQRKHYDSVLSSQCDISRPHKTHISVWGAIGIFVRLPFVFALVSCSAYSLTLKMEAIRSSETSVVFQRTTRRYILDFDTFYFVGVKCWKGNSGQRKDIHILLWWDWDKA